MKSAHMAQAVKPCSYQTNARTLQILWICTVTKITSLNNTDRSKFWNLRIHPQLLVKMCPDTNCFPKAGIFCPNKRANYPRCASAPPSAFRQLIHAFIFIDPTGGTQDPHIFTPINTAWRRPQGD